MGRIDLTNGVETLTVPEQTLVGRVTGGNIAALTLAQVLGMDTGTPTATLGPELGSGSGLTQTVTTAIGSTYQVGGSGVTAITLDAATLTVSNGYSSFVATATSHTLVGTGGTNLSVKLVTLGSRTATVTLAGAPVRTTVAGSCLAIGTDSQRSLTSGSRNVGLGISAQYSLTTGWDNLGLGISAQYSLTTGGNNIGLGTSSQRSLTTGGSNVGLGPSSQYSLTTGWDNIGLGISAQYYLATGGNNIGLGTSSQRSLTTGGSNVGLGSSAQYSPKGNTANATTTANYQTAVGRESGQYSAATGDRGVAVGYRAIYHTGAVALGSDSEAQGTDSIAIGRAAIAANANTIQIGATGTAYTLSFGNAGRVVGLVELKSIVAAAADFAAFKTAIAALS